jgi:hypothetical protein
MQYSQRKTQQKEEMSKLTAQQRENR